MRGYSHALSGAVTGTAAGLVLHMPVLDTATLAGFTAGTALLPDLDSCGSCAARSLGLLSSAVAHVVRFVSGGHRHATHSLLGIAAFTGLAWLACAFRSDIAGKAGLALLVCLAASAAVGALHLAGGHVADVLGISAAAAVVWAGYGLALIPLAVALGTATHIAGDMLTIQGCPLAWPLTKAHQFLLPSPLRFTTGRAAERFAVGPVLLVALGVLAWHAAISAGA